MPGKKKGGLLHSVIKRVIKDKQAKAKEVATAAKAESVSKKEAKGEARAERPRDEGKVEKGGERKDEKKVKQEKVREQREV